MDRENRTSRPGFIRVKKLAAVVSGAFAGMAWATLAFGQNCAMCYNNAAASGPAAIRALRSGIVALLVPPVLMFLGIFVLVFRSKERLRENPRVPIAEQG